MKFNVLTVVNRKTALRIRRIYELYKKQGFMWQQYIACLDPIWEVQGQKDYSLTPEVYGKILIELFEMWAIDFEQGQQPYIRQFENYIGILMGKLPEACEQRGVCSFQNVVEADGSVYPCDFYVLDEFKLGSFVENDFYEIEEQRKRSGFIERSFNHNKTCRACRYFYICRGGCCRHREQPGTQTGVNYFCRSYQMFFDTCLPQMKKITARCTRTESLLRVP